MKHSDVIYESPLTLQHFTCTLADALVESREDTNLGASCKKNTFTDAAPSSTKKTQNTWVTNDDVPEEKKQQQTQICVRRPAKTESTTKIEAGSRARSPRVVHTQYGL